MHQGEQSPTPGRPGRAVGTSGALLAIEVASESTAVVLVDRVEDTFRFIARAERPSTHRPPIRDAMLAVDEAIGEIEQLTGRQLLRAETLLTPQRDDGSGVDAVVVSSSDLPALNVLLLADSRSRAAQHALSAMRGLPLAVQDTINPRATDFEQRSAALSQAGVDCVVVAAALPADTERIMRVLEGSARHARSRPLAIFCGAEVTRLTSSEDFDVEHVPALVEGATAAEPLRAALRRRVHDLLPLRLPGLRRLQALGGGIVGSVVEDQALTLRFLATQRKRSLLYVSADGAAAFAAAAGKQFYAGALDGELGLRTGAPHVMLRRGVEAIARWLPESIPAAALRNRIMNRSLRPHLPSIDSDDLMLDAALLREALLEPLQSIGSSRFLADTIIGGGALASCPLPALSALALLDLLPAEHGLVELALDRGMLATAGALARIDPTAAASLAAIGEPLATAILLGATPPILNIVARVELMPQDGQAVSVDVRRGQIVRLPLARGKRAELRVRPAGLGSGAKGAEIHRQVSGSLLGIVVDARSGRPALPAAAAKRSAAIRSWLAALDSGVGGPGEPRRAPG